MKLKCGDKVIVNTGKYKGKEGIITKFILNKKNKLLKVIVEGINIVKKCVKANPSQGKQGGIIKVEAPIHYSNIPILNNISGKADKIGFKYLDNGKKVRYFKSNSEIILNG